MFFVLFPLANLGIVGFQFLLGWQALRNFGQYVQYNAPGDVVTSWPSWKIPTGLDPRYPITNFKLFRGAGAQPAVCSSTNTSTPRYYSYETTVTLPPPIPMSPMVRSALCSQQPAPCSLSYPLSYSAPFQ
jgi:hypothetical protein